VNNNVDLSSLYGSPAGAGGSSSNGTNGKSKNCSTGQRVLKGALAAESGMDATAALAGTVSLEALGGSLFVGGCIEPTPFEPATCALGASAFGLITPGAAGLGYAGVRLFKNDTIPNVEAAASGICTD
jgi:hypothetical protein